MSDRKMKPSQSRPGQPFSFRKLGILAGFLAFVAAGICFVESRFDKYFIFDPAHLEDLSQRAISAHGNDTSSVVEFIVSELDQKVDAKYMNHDRRWVFNNAGGAMGAMFLIHASITEYLIIFGTAIGTEGHTGRHTADDYFNILQGTQVAYTPGSYEPEIYPQGSVHFLPRGQVKQYGMPQSCFALEYARGWIPPMLFFGYADTFTSTLDFPNLWTTTVITGRQMISNLLVGKL